MNASEIRAAVHVRQVTVFVTAAAMSLTSGPAEARPGGPGSFDPGPTASLTRSLAQRAGRRANAYPLREVRSPVMIRSAVNSSKCLHKQNPGWDNGNRIHLWDCRAGPREMKTWELDPATGYIRSALNPDKCFHKERPGWDNGNPIHLWDCDAGSREMKAWRFEPATGYIRSAVNSRKCLHKQTPGWDNGNVIHLWDCNAGSAEMKTWVLDARAELEVHRGPAALDPVFIPDNRCARGVPNQVQQLGAVKAELLEHRSPEYYPEFADQKAERWWNHIKTSGSALDLGFALCHVQGLARLTGLGAEGTFAINANNWSRKESLGCGGQYELTEAGPSLFTSTNGLIPPAYTTVELFVQDYERSGYDNTAYSFEKTPEANYHPGGMQALGGYIVVGTDNGGPARGDDSMIWIINAYDPEHPRLVNWFYNPHSRAEALAVARLPDGRIVILVEASQGTRYEMFVSNTTNIATADFTRAELHNIPLKYPDEGDTNPENLAFVKECATDSSEPKLYLATLSSEWYGRCAGGADACDKSVLQLYRLHQISPDRFSFAYALPWKVMMRNPCDENTLKNVFGIDLEMDVCPNWAAGGTIWVNEEGLLEAYATEHKPAGNDLDVLVWKALYVPSGE